MSPETRTAQGKAAVLVDFAWSRFDQILDIGGAFGSMLAGILEAFPTAHGVLFDLPQVCPMANSTHCILNGKPTPLLVMHS